MVVAADTATSTSGIQAVDQIRNKFLPETGIVRANLVNVLQRPRIPPLCVIRLSSTAIQQRDGKNPSDHRE